MKRLGFTALCALLVFSISCKKSAPPVHKSSDDPLNRVEHAPSVPPNNFLHKTFQFDRVAKFEFEVPSHTISPKLEGTFQSFVVNEDKDMTSNDDANVDLLLLDEDELNDFLHEEPFTPKYQVSASHGQTIDYSLSSTFDQPQKYYLLFRNPTPKGLARWVKADFTASFQ
jgi:hypothetical protein